MHFLCCLSCSEAVRVLKACSVAVQVASDVGLGRWVKLLNARGAAHARIKQYELKQILDLSEQVRPTWHHHLLLPATTISHALPELQWSHVHTMGLEPGACQRHTIHPWVKPGGSEVTS
jgi:hypothetical protein